MVADGAAQKVAGTVTDNAGNTASTSVTLAVDRTAPVVTITGATDGTVYGPDVAPVVSCVTTDAVSGVAGQATARDVENNGKHTVTCAGATDKAGNAAATVQLTYTVKPTVEWLIALTHKVMPGASAVTLRQLDADLTASRWVAYTARVWALTQGAKPVLSAADATTLVYWAARLQCNV